jgi:predicted unusual protein kinase regulating ubiquinone biosynthesis (AarF/ABC1/UbiB family)
MLTLKPNYLKRYKDVAWLLYKYGRSDLVQQSGLSESLGGVASSSDADANGRAGAASPEQLARDLESLGPAYVKLGQLLSTRTDFLPEPYVEALARLQDDAAPAPWNEIEQVLIDEFQTHPDHIFAELDREPMAAASLGQVYRATLRDGRPVIVKVQRPGIAPLLREDLEAFAQLAETLHHHTDFGRRFQVRPLVETLSRTIAGELDYRREAHDSHLMAENLREFDRLVVPRAIEHLTRPRVLTMERIEGVKITNVSPVVLVEVDRTELVGQLFRAYLRQVLVDGVFHSDPHPGNLLLTPDGRIALLDFGMVTRISTETRLSLVKLLLAISHGDGEEAARIAETMGEPTPRFDRQDFARRITRLVAEHHDVPVREVGAGRIIMHIQRAAGEAGIVVPESLTMLGKALMNLDRVVAVLDPDFNPAAAIQEQSAAIVRQYSQRRMSLTQLYQSLLDATDLVQNLPSRINSIIKRLAENDLEVKVRTIDEVKLIRGLHKVANRIAVGLVIAALIVGASNMMAVEGTGRLFGYPALPLVVFTCAVLAAVVLLWRAVAGDDAEERD